MNYTRTNAELDLGGNCSSADRDRVVHNGNLSSTVQECIHLYGKSCLSGLISKNLTLCIKCFVKNTGKCVFVVIFV